MSRLIWIQTVWHWLWWYSWKNLSKKLILTKSADDKRHEKLPSCCGFYTPVEGVQWLSGRVLDSRPRGCGFEPHRCLCVVSLSENINPSLVLVQLRKTRPFIPERLLIGGKESNQTKRLKGTCNVSYKRLCQTKHSHTNRIWVTSGIRKL